MLWFQTLKDFIIANPLSLAPLVIIVLLLFYSTMKRYRLKKLARRLDDFEVRYNSLKSVPLSFKLTKSEAMVKVSDELEEEIDSFKDSFEAVQKKLQTLASLLNDADDALASLKVKPTRLIIEEMESILTSLEGQVTTLDQTLDDVLIKESDLRAQVNQEKEKLINLKSEFANNVLVLKHLEPVINLHYQTIDRHLNAFEEWMYVNEYDKASLELNSVINNIKELEELNTKLPQLLNLITGSLPTLIETIEKRYALALAQGASLVHLEVIKNIEMIKENIKIDYDRLIKGDILEVEVHLENSLTRLNQLHDQINREIDANADVDEIKKHFIETYNLSHAGIDQAEKAYQIVKDRFDFSLAMANINKSIASLEGVYTSYQNLNRYAIETKMSPATHAIELKQLLQKLVIIYDDVNQNKSKIELVQQYEERAKQQLVKLRLIINEMLVKIKSNQLPSISEDFEGDVNRGYQYLNTISNLLGSSELDVGLLNDTLDEAIDYIYKLYNNVNDIVGMAVMVENSIVYGNRYRSTFPELDSELTKAEISYHNGEYTHALKTVINAMEKFQPGSYEKLVKE